MDGANQLYGSGRHMRGGAWYNDLWDGIKSVGSQVLPIALQMAPMLMKGMGHNGGALNLAGRGLSLGWF